MNWNHMPPTQMAALAHGVADAISKNAATFTSPVVLPNDLDAAATALELAYANRLNGAVAKTTFQNADEALDTLLHKEAAYVSSVANGDKTIIQLANFAATSNERLPKTIPATPNAPKVSGNAAALRVETNNVKGADAFTWLIFTDAKNVATPAMGSNYFNLSAPATVIGNGHFREELHNVIPAGTSITVMVMAHNSAGQSAFSTPVSFTVGS
jgi:hypothetical protein